MKKTLKECSNLTRLDRPYDFTEHSNNIYPNSVHIVGFEFDGTASFRKGTRLGPNAARETSYQTESYSPSLDLDLEDFKDQFVDLGNITFDKTRDANSAFMQGTENFFKIFEGLSLPKDNIKFLTIGGEHSIPYAPITTYLKQYPDLLLIHLDAHSDLRDGYEGYKFSHASIIRRVIDHFTDGHTLLQHGIRSGPKDEFAWMKKNNTLIDSLEDLLLKVEQTNSKRPIYLTLDVDYFDPSVCPGTGTPEAGGESFQSFIKLLKLLKQKNFVGADIVELAPDLDPTNNSSVFVGKLIREVLLTLVR